MFTFTALSTYPYCLSIIGTFQIWANQVLQLVGKAPIDFTVAVCDYLNFAQRVNPT